MSRRTSLLLLFIALSWAAAAARAEEGAGCAPASATSQPLARIVNTRDHTYHCLIVSIDHRQDVTAVRFETHDGTDDGAGGPVRIRAFAPAEIAQAGGVVLDGVPGHDAVILQGDIVAGVGKAELILKFLHNGITGEFQQCAVRLEHAGARWRLADAQDRAVPLVVVRTWALPILGTVGIDTLEGICP